MSVSTDTIQTGVIPGRKEGKEQRNILDALLAVKETVEFYTGIYKKLFGNEQRVIHGSSTGSANNAGDAGKKDDKSNKTTTVPDSNVQDKVMKSSINIESVDPENCE